MRLSATKQHKFTKRLLLCNYSHSLIQKIKQQKESIDKEIHESVGPESEHSNFTAKDIWVRQLAAEILLRHVTERAPIVENFLYLTKQESIKCHVLAEKYRQKDASIVPEQRVWEALHDYSGWFGASELTKLFNDAFTETNKGGGSETADTVVQPYLDVLGVYGTGTYDNSKLHFEIAESDMKKLDKTMIEQELKYFFDSCAGSGKSINVMVSVKYLAFSYDQATKTLKCKSDLSSLTTEIKDEPGANSKQILFEFTIPSQFQNNKHSKSSSVNGQAMFPPADEQPLPSNNGINSHSFSTKPLSTELKTEESLPSHQSHFLIALKN